MGQIGDMASVSTSRRVERVSRLLVGGFLCMHTLRPAFGFWIDQRQDEVCAHFI